MYQKFTSPHVASNSELQASGPNHTTTSSAYSSLTSSPEHLSCSRELGVTTLTALCSRQHPTKDAPPPTMLGLDHDPIPTAAASPPPRVARLAICFCNGLHHAWSVDILYVQMQQQALVSEHYGQCKATAAYHMRQCRHSALVSSIAHCLHPLRSDSSVLPWP